MLRFTASVDGVQVLDRAFNRITEHLSDFRSIWPGVAKEFYAIEEGQFASEGGKGASGKWAPLSPAYKRWKTKHYPREPILQLHHDLYNSMTDPEAPGAVYRVEKDELVMGSSVPYAKRHQKTRPIISLTEKDKRTMQKAIQAGLVRFTRQLGFQVEEKVA